MNKNDKRIYELDLFRGIAVVLMIFDHMMYDIWGLLPTLFANFPGGNQFFRMFYDFSLYYWDNPIRIIVRYLVIFVFLAITGICCSLSRNNLKRGLKLLAVSLVLTILTGVFGYLTGDIDQMITFGILHCIACSLIIISLIDKLMVDRRLFLFAGILFIVLGSIIESGQSYQSYVGNNIFLVVFNQIIGFRYAGGDSFQLPLNLGMIMIGVFIGKKYYLERKSLLKAKYHNNLISFTGRNSLLIYFLHQIILPVFMSIILLCCGYKILL